jgi:very-short-patch-repair endonuclease
MDDLSGISMSAAGVFTTAAARMAGRDERSLYRLVKRGVVEHLGRGLYAVPAPGLSAEGAHLRLATGGLLLYPDAALSHVSAVVAHGLPVLDAPLNRATLVRPVTKEVLTQSFVIRPDGQQVVETGSGRAVEPATALVQFTLDAGVGNGVVAADRALHTGVVERPTLERAGAAVAGWPRSGRVRSMLALADGRSESVGESRLRLHLAALGISVVPQVVIRDEMGDFVARVDLWVEGTGVVVEFDGRVKYAEGGADVLFAEKRREDRLRRLGYVVVRAVWADLFRPERVVAWIRQAQQAAPDNPALTRRRFVG